jgi:hypothetical protein
METSHSSTVQQTREMREILQRTILLAIRNFEESSDCRVEAIDMEYIWAMGRPSRTCSVECRVVL